MPDAGRRRRAAAAAGSIAAVVLLWAALLVPGRPEPLGVAALRIPVEACVLAGLAALPASRIRSALLAGCGVVLAAVTLAHLLDLGFLLQVGRPFDPTADWPLLGSAMGVLRDSIGDVPAGLALAAAALLAAGLPIALAAAALRLPRLLPRPRVALRGALAAALAWSAVAGLGLRTAPGVPVAASEGIGGLVTEVARVGAAVDDDRAFTAGLHQRDPLAALPTDRLLARLRGKDVVLAFVESYGRVALEDPLIAPGVERTLHDGDAELRAAGFGSRSALLTSPTYGGISWLAHSTLQSGLWVDRPGRYDALLGSSRFTLSAAFRKAGWRTVDDVPSDTGPWPEGQRFYRFDAVYGLHDVGYAGPRFGYARVPDQFTLAAFRRLELQPGHRPVMAEIDLVSSHTPWTPLPRTVPAGALGDGSVYDAMPAQGLSRETAWQDPRVVRQLYGQSIQYSLQSLVDFVAATHDPDLVVVLLGDHQPSATVSGAHASHDVPVSIVARDPSVLGAAAGWGWTPGLRPGPSAPPARMDRFRDRFITAFSR